MTERLAEQTCTPCRGGVPPLSIDEARRYLEQAPQWNLQDDAGQIQRTFWFENFREALNFAREVGELAESEHHHPDVSFGWGYATIFLRTKKIKGLHQNDFIMAAKIDRLARLCGAHENRVQRQRSPADPATRETHPSNGDQRSTQAQRE